MNKSQNTEKKRKARIVSQKKVRGKLAFILCFVGAAFVLLLARIYKIQNENQDAYNKIVLSQRQSEYVSKTIPARRGDIYDRNGNRLATSEKVYIMIIDPRQMRQAEAANAEGVRSRYVVEPTVAAIADCFGVDKKEVEDLIRDNQNSSYIRFLKDVSYDEKQNFLTYQEEKNKDFAKSADLETKKQKITGVWFEDNYKRTYPYGSLACSVVGFSNADGTTGTGGVEQYYNETLTGVAGREYGYLNDDANLEKVVKSASNGNTLILTIDASIQNIVEKYLAEWKNGEPGSKSAACIVMNPNNGEVLAMASTDSFDLNNPGTTGDYTEEELYNMGLTPAVNDYKSKHPDELAITKEQVPEYYSREEILSFGKSTAMYKIWRNTCVSDTYEPGSPQKVFTVAGALEEGVITPQDTFNCEGNIQLTDGVNTWKISCVNRNGHGLLDVTGGITNSCNVVMMNIAFLEKAETFMKYERIFGFGDYTGIDLPAEADTRNMGFESDDIGRTQLATNSFGQNYNCTMIQMASAYCSIVNGGSYYKPHVVKQILTADGTLVFDEKETLVRQTVSKSTCDFLKGALFETVETGTGKAAAVAGYHVGGKTGTAEKLPRSAKKYLVSFCGFAPVEDPELLCYVIVDEPSLPGEEAAHSTFASNVFSKILAEALPAIGLYPEGISASEYKAPDILLPDLPEEETQNAETPEEGEEETEEPLTSAPPETDEFISVPEEGEADGEEAFLPELLSPESE